MAPAAAHAVDNIVEAIDLNATPGIWRRKNGILLYFLLTSSFLSSLASGFDGVSFLQTAQIDNISDFFCSP